MGNWRPPLEPSSELIQTIEVGGWVGQSNTPLEACSRLGEPRGPGFCDKGLHPRQPTELEAGSTDASRSPGGAAPRDRPGGSSVLTDYSVVEEVYLRMWAEHGQSPGAGWQGGNQWRLKTDPPGQTGGRAWEPQEGGQRRGREPASQGPCQQTIGRKPKGECVCPQEPQGTAAMGAAQGVPRESHH